MASLFQTFALNLETIHYFKMPSALAPKTLLRGKPYIANE